MRTVLAEGADYTIRVVPLFVTACLVGGAGGVIGSMLGSMYGKPGVIVGGVLGGLLAAPLTAGLAVWRRWVNRRRFHATALGTAIGFFAAAAIALLTLSSPVGPMLSTLLIGTGAVLGGFDPAVVPPSSSTES
jgi:hypothetical protein